MTAVNEHLTAKQYVHQIVSNNVNESSFFRFDPDEKEELDGQGSIILNSCITSTKTTEETLPNHLLIAYLKTIGTNVIHHQYLTITIVNLIITT